MISDETLEFLWSVHEEANKFSREPETVDSIPQSMGHYFQQKFSDWLNQKSEDYETTLWRKQLYNWFIKFEECDTGCDDFYQHSCISWGEYIDYGEDNSFSNGYRSVLDKMVSKIQEKVQIILETRVSRIEYNGDKVNIETENGKTFQADHVISTMSLGVLKKYHDSLFSPALPKALINAMSSISFGTIDRIKLDFQEAFWDLEDPGLLIVQESENLITEVNRQNWFRHIFTFDEVIFHPTTLMGWLSGDAARFMETLTDQEIADDICDYLENIIKEYKNDPTWKLPELKRIIVTRWNSNTNFCGVYSYRNQDSDANGIKNKDLSTPILVRGCPRILFAGEATDEKHYGTVHGALSAAEREVNRLKIFWKNNVLNAKSEK